MKKKMMAIFAALVMLFSLAACGAGEETTLTGMVVSVDGTVISLMEMDTANMGSMDFTRGERGEMPEGMEGFQGFGDFNPEDLEGMFPDGMTPPQWGEGEMPEDMTPPEGMMPPEGMTMPADGQMPDFGGANSGRPDFGGENGGMPNFGGFGTDVETQELDIAQAHISVEIDGGKASGTMDDIKAGTFVTVTVNAKGQVTYVLVSAQTFSYGGGRRSAN